MPRTLPSMQVNDDDLLIIFGHNSKIINITGVTTSTQAGDALMTIARACGLADTTNTPRPVPGIMVDDLTGCDDHLEALYDDNCNGGDDVL